MIKKLSISIFSLMMAVFLFGSLLAMPANARAEGYKRTQFKKRM